VSFVVDPESLRAAGRAIAGSAARAAGDLARLQRAVHDGGVAPWAPIGPVYQELIALTDEALGLVGGGLAKSGADTQRMADAYARTEDLVRGAFDRIGAALGAAAAVTLSPAHADLLARTGRPWPDAADEDRIVAMADGWRALGTRLDAAYRDHTGVARSIRTRNGSTGVAAFGEWATRFDDGLPWFVEICARVEAALLRAARTVLAAKNAILDALDDLAAWLDDAHRRLSGVPVVGGALAAPAELVEPLVDAARLRIAAALEDVTRQLVDDILPTLGGLVELDKRLVQELRKLVKGEAGAHWPTTASASARPGNTPRGRAATWGRVEEDKVSANQTDRVVINIDAPDAAASLADLRRQFQEHPIPGLKEAKVIDHGGAIVDIYPRPRTTRSTWAPP
jgi:hypothetical protein